MRKVVSAVFFFLFPAHILHALAPCSIQRAAAAEGYVWLLCDEQQLFVSADQGTSWQVRKLPTAETMRAIAFLDARRGFVAGEAGTLLGTEDGGLRWRQIPLPTRENLTSIHFVGEHGWLAGWAGVILHTADGGRSWERQPSGVLHGLESIYFVDAAHGWVVGWAGTILRTTDGGRTWERARSTNTLWSLESVYFVNPSQGWAVGFGGQILKTTDGGVSWHQQTHPSQAWLKSVMFDDSGRGWIVSDHLLLESRDHGETWQTIPVNDVVFLHQLLRVKGSLWAVGQFGVLKQAEDSGLVALATLPSNGDSRNANE